jgi:hypothetical protein
VVELSGPKTADPPAEGARVVFTSGRPLAAELAVALARFGIAA